MRYEPANVIILWLDAHTRLLERARDYNQSWIVGLSNHLAVVVLAALPYLMLMWVVAYLIK